MLHRVVPSCITLSRLASCCSAVGPHAWALQRPARGDGAAANTHRRLRRGAPCGAINPTLLLCTAAAGRCVWPGAGGGDPGLRGRGWPCATPSGGRPGGLVSLVAPGRSVQWGSVPVGRGPAWSACHWGIAPPEAHAGPAGGAAPRRGLARVQRKCQPGRGSSTKVAPHFAAVKAPHIGHSESKGGPCDRTSGLFRESPPRPALAVEGALHVALPGSCYRATRHSRPVRHT